VIACARGEAGLAELRADIAGIETHACDMRDAAAVDA
jgi:short-subunit dehydrogenase involved in D-alanine esterification of teichoic acids